MFRGIGDISEWSEPGNQPEPYIVQRYIHNPLLIGHKKFDMRIYVLVTSHNPLTVYLYRSGFGRFTHYRYEANDIYNHEMRMSNFLPLTYNLPSEYPIFAEEFKRHR